MGLINVPGSAISSAQEVLLGYGRQAVIASTWKAYASLANNQTFIIPENSSGSPSLVTFEIEKSASGWTPTGGAVVAIDCTAAATLVALLAIVRDFLNARPNAAYVWAINGTSDGLVGTAKYAGSQWNIVPTGTALTSGSVSTSGTDPIAAEGNQNLSLPAKGDIRVGAGAPSPDLVMSRPADGSWYVGDSTQSTGHRATSFADRNRFVVAPSAAIDWANGIHQVLQLANGANAITVLGNPESGLTHQLKIIQPASGAAGTITIAGSYSSVVKLAAGFAISATNGAHNILTLTYDDTTNPLAPVWSVSASQEFLP